MELLYKEEVYEIIGAAMEVHKELGCGFLEAVYQEALEIEFNLQGIHHEREKMLRINYKREVLNKHYVADFICFDSVIVELKALSALTSDHEAQILNYLKAANMRVGLIINFGEKSLKFKRFVF